MKISCKVLLINFIVFFNAILLISQDNGYSVRLDSYLTFPLSEDADDITFGSRPSFEVGLYKSINSKKEGEWNFGFAVSRMNFDMGRGTRNGVKVDIKRTLHSLKFPITHNKFFNKKREGLSLGIGLIPTFSLRKDLEELDSIYGKKYRQFNIYLPINIGYKFIFQEKLVTSGLRFDSSFYNLQDSYQDLRIFNAGIFIKLEIF